MYLLVTFNTSGLLIHNIMATQQQQQQQQQGAPSRPWLRLATMVRPPPPPTQQPNQAPPPPRPAFIRPTLTQIPAPPNPPPPNNGVAQTSPPRATVPRPSPIPRVTTSPPPTISPPPSPLRLPSPQLNTYQQKTLLTQETKEKPKGESLKKHSDSDDVRMRIITIAGENKGAIMELSKRTLKKDNHPTASSDGDSDGKNKNQKSKTPLMNAIMNSNIQGVNNSILYNCSTSHHDPGVHLSLSRKPNSIRDKLINST